MNKEETKKCGECLAEIPKKAKKCSHCSSKQKEKYGVKHLVIGIFVIFIFSIIISMSGTGGGGSVANTSGSKKVEGSEAFIIAQSYVKSALKSPSTADFPTFDYSVQKISEDEFKITSYVDSQNSFGAEVRTSWTAITLYVGGDWADQRNWVLEELIMDGKLIYPIVE